MCTCIILIYSLNLIGWCKNIVYTEDEIASLLLQYPWQVGNGIMAILYVVQHQLSSTLVYCSGIRV